MSEPNATQAAEVAHAMSECMNLLFVFAAPRVFESYRLSSPTPVAPAAAEACLARFVAAARGIRERATASEEEIHRVSQVAVLCEELRRSLATTSFDAPLPAAVIQPARRALAALGFPTPAAGWDAFDGYPVSAPPSAQ